MTGQSISHYKILEKLGEGGMGVVYKAEDTRLKRTVALKFLPPEWTCDEAARVRLIREARTASSIDHSNICTIYEIDETADNRTFIAMAYYGGKTLKEKMGQNTIPLDEALDIILQTAEGLSKAHDQGISHRDIKPANIYITDDGIVKILDFGLAKLAGQTQITRTGATPGTAAYMSPEQVKGGVIDQRSDIWSLGVVLYEMITGTMPFKGENGQVVIYSILNKNPIKANSIAAGIPDELERIIDKALQKNVNKRYLHIDQMKNDLINARQNRQSHFPKKKAPVFFLQKMKKQIVPIGILILLFIAFFLFKSFVFTRKHGNKPISVTVISFENQTGNQAYDYLQEAIPNLLITGLEDSPSFQVTTWERLHDLIKQTGKAKSSVIDTDTGFELCSLDGIDALVLGSFIKTGDTFAVDVKVLDGTTKSLLKRAHSQGTGVESILKHQIDELSREISEGVILPEKQIQPVDTKIMDVTTSSMEAYYYFIRGRDESLRATGEEAKYFKKALGIDSTFSMAYLWFGRTYFADLTERNKLFMKAKQYSNRATKKEQIYIQAELEADDEKKIGLYRQIINQYPKEKHAYYLLGECYAFRENFTAAIAACLKALALDPYFAPATKSLCYLYAETGVHQKADDYLKRFSAISPGDTWPMQTVANIYYLDGKLDEAIEKYKEASELNPETGSEANIAFLVALKGDFESAIQWMNEYIGHESSDYMRPGGRAFRGYFYLLTGKYQEAFTDLKFAHDKFEEYHNAKSQALIDVGTGMLFYEKTDYKKSRDYLNEYKRILAKENTPPTSNFANFTCEPLLGLIDVRQGNMDSARMKLENKNIELADAHVTIKELVDVQYQLLNAEMLLAQGSTDAAIAIGEQIKELAPPRYNFSPDRLIFYNLPVSKDILARAYIKKGKTDKAIAEYERLIHFNPASQDRRLMFPKYHYYVAILYQEKGLKTKAANHFKQFLEIWRNADEDLPELIDAKKRYAELSNN